MYNPTNVPLSMGFWRAPPDFSTLYCSPGINTAFGLAKDGSALTSAAFACMFEDKERIAAIKHGLLTGQSCEDVELWITRPNGERRLLRLSGGCEFDAEGAIAAVHGVVVDVTELHQVAQTAAEKDELLCAFIDHAPAALAMFDADMRYLRVSPQWLTDFGNDCQRIIGRSLYDVFPDIPPAWKDAHRRCLQGATEKRERDFVVHADGTKRCVAWEVRPWLTRNGEIGGVLMTARDITPLVESIEALEVSEKRLSLALEAGGMLVWRRDIGSEIITARGAVGHFLGNAVGDLLTREEMRSVIHPDDYEPFLETFQRSAEIEGPVSCEHRLVPDGSREIWALSIMETLRDEQNKRFAHIGIVKDITEERARAQVLQRAHDAARASSEAKSRFLQTMSHEIRTPLNGVLAVAQALARTSLTARQREMTKLIESAGRCLHTLVDQALDLSRIEAGVLSLADAPFDIAAAVEDAAALFESAAHEKRVAFSCDVRAVDNVAVRGDVTRFAQVVRNLVGNAVKFTEKGRVEVVAAASVAVDGFVDIRVCVRDTGIGVDPKIGTRIFERFARSDAAIAHDAGGVGLGLTISRGVANEMGGDIDFVSVPQIGSSFVFTCRLPWAQTISPDMRQHSILEAQRQVQVEILVAEDNPLNQQILSLLFEPVAARLTFVETGEEACLAARRQDFDLVLMDMQMPVMDGLDAIRAIRAFEAVEGMSRLPIICLTAQAGADQIAAARAAGADDHVAKPIDFDHLFAAIDRALGHQSIAPAA